MIDSMKKELANEKNNSSQLSKKLSEVTNQNIRLVADLATATQNAFIDLEKENATIESTLNESNKEIARLKQELDTAKSESKKAFEYARTYCLKVSVLTFF